MLLELSILPERSVDKINVVSSHYLHIFSHPISQDILFFQEKKILELQGAYEKCLRWVRKHKCPILYKKKKILFLTI